MRTRPVDVSDDAIRDAVAAGWGLGLAALDHRPVGFGSHHWSATDRTGGGWFVTVDDLDAKRRDATDTTDAAFERLARTFDAVCRLRADGLAFVVAPVPTLDDEPIRRIDQRYSVVLHPFVTGRNPGDDGVYDTASDRAAVVDLLVQLHASGAAIGRAAVDDLALPHRDHLTDALASLDEPWDTGPYAEAARTLVRSHEDGLRRVMRAWGPLADEVGAGRERWVATHGEPHPGNVLVAGGRYLLIDWDTLLVAPPERDLWGLDPGDGSVLDAYRRRTGTIPDPAALDLGRLWFDLDEVGGYLALFRAPHGDDADLATAWLGLVDHLQPDRRWPHLGR